MVLMRTPSVYPGDPTVLTREEPWDWFDLRWYRIAVGTWTIWYGLWTFEENPGRSSGKELCPFELNQGFLTVSRTWRLRKARNLASKTLYTYSARFWGSQSLRSMHMFNSVLEMTTPSSLRMLYNIFSQYIGALTRMYRYKYKVSFKRV